EGRSRQVASRHKLCLGSTPAAIALCADKTALARLWNSVGVNTPASLSFESVKYPSVCKPRHGAGSQATFRIDTPSDLDRCLAQGSREMPGDDFILQEYVGELAVSVSFLIGPAQTLALSAGGQILCDDDRFRYLGGVLPLPSALAERALRLSERAIA